MPAKSPRLSKKEKDKLAKRQINKVERLSDAVDEARGTVGELKQKRAAKHAEVKRLQGHLDALDDKLSAHSLTQKRNAKSTEVTMAKSDLEAVIDELSRAMAVLQSKVQKRDGTVWDLKNELAAAHNNDDEDGDDDDDDTDDE